MASNDARIGSARLTQPSSSLDGSATERTSTGLPERESPLIVGPILPLVRTAQTVFDA